MEKYSADWVREQAGEAMWLDHHRCGGCGAMVGYHLNAGGVFFDPTCDCGPAWEGPRPSSFEEIADWLRMQSSDEIRDRIMQGFKP